MVYITLSYAPTFTTALELDCIGCTAGHYLDAVNETHGTCRRCPADSTTPPGATAFDRLHCVCDPGHTPVSNACTECEAGLYKPLLGNHTCTPCPAEAHTNGTGKTALGDCLCNPGFTLGEHRVSPPSIDMYGSSISIARGGYTLVTSPPNHPFRVSTHASWSRDYDYDGMTVNGDMVTVYVPDDFEGELYYYCYSHKSMHGSLHLDPSLIQCTACGPGTFKDEIGDGACDVCPENHYCPGNTVVPEQCPAVACSRICVSFS